MKNISVLAVILVLGVSANAQYEWLNPKPSGYINTAITFTDVAHGFLFIYNGELFKTSDTGNSWQLQQRFPVS